MHTYFYMIFYSLGFFCIECYGKIRIKEVRVCMFACRLKECLDAILLIFRKKNNLQKIPYYNNFFTLSK